MKKYILQSTEDRIETHIDFKGDLNQQQYDVVTGSDGPCLVLAGAGSGKTRTLIYRLAYLLEKGVQPYNILLMTFTNKAAREMRERTEMLLKYEPKGLWSGTFHHVANRSLRMYAERAGYQKDFGILDQDDSRSLVKACMKDLKALVRSEKFPKASVVQSLISLSENTNKTIGKILEERAAYFEDFTEEIEKVKERYRVKKKESNNMDYDDLLSKWKWMLENVKEVRERFCDQFKYIMVDEYQDTNFMQADIVNVLGEKHRNILAVGDDAQSIYSFRGARVENILQFPKKYKNTKIFKLETNYRSSPEILDLANDSLLNNNNQFEKKLTAVNESVEKPALVYVDDPYAQARFVAQRVKELKESGSSLSDIAVLFRAHYQSAELEMELVKKGIPYVVRGGIRFFEQAHIKDVLSYVRIIVNPFDEVAWIRALTLCPGIGPGYAEKIYVNFRKSERDIVAFIRSQDLSRVIPKKALTGYQRFNKVMRMLIDKDSPDSPDRMVKGVLDSGYETHLFAVFDNAKDRVDDIHELINFSHSYSSINDFLSDITLREGFKGEYGESAGEDEDTLILSTIHQSKGLEWDTVMIIGLCEGHFPHPKAMQDNVELEEERRLFYVAATRAKVHLYMVYPATRYDYSKGQVSTIRSRFLEELMEESYEEWEVSSSRNRYSDNTERYDYDDDEDDEDIDVIEL